jgi:hypothetical protein
VTSSSRATYLSDRDTFAQVPSAKTRQIKIHFLGRPFEATRLLLLFGNGKEEPSGLSENVYVP